MASSTFSCNISTTTSYVKRNVTGYSLMTEGATFKAVKLLLYAVIFVISVVGNTLVCIVIAKRRRMRTVTNYFILNLAIADLAMTCVCIPFDIPVQENNYKWPYGPFMCRVLYPLQTVSTFASIFTLTVLSLNRFRAIVHPLRKQMDIQHMKVAVVLIWSLSLVLTSPYIVALELDWTKHECDEVWPSRRSRRTYTASLFVFQYLLPLTVIICTYVRIGLELRKRLRGGGSNTAPGSQYQRETRRVVRMLVVVTLLFAVSVLPNNVMWLWLDFGRGRDYAHFRDIVAITNIVLFANSAANPIVYTICHENFREQFKVYFTCNLRVLQHCDVPRITRNRFRSFSGTLRSQLMAPSTPTEKEQPIVWPKETVV